ncbi:MAG TPA: hypothetical protein PLT08_10835 [Anaerolineales bacterium]|nr:hypothetical protein [Anaerolineales bacterium]
MNLFVKALLLILAVGVGSIATLIGFRRLRLSDENLTVFQKMKKSIAAGFMFSVAILSFFSAIPIFLRSNIHLDFDVNKIFPLFSCIFIPCLIIISIGVFIQISYLEFLIHSGKKK